MYFVLVLTYGNVARKQILLVIEKNFLTLKKIENKWLKIENTFSTK